MAIGRFATLNPAFRVKELFASNGDPGGIGEDGNDRLFPGVLGHAHPHRHSRHRHAHRIIDDNRFDNGQEGHRVGHKSNIGDMPTFRSWDPPRFKSEIEDTSRTQRLSDEVDSSWWLSEASPSSTSGFQDEKGLYRSVRHVGDLPENLNDEDDYKVIPQKSDFLDRPLEDKLYDVVPFNTNEDSDSAHFDVEFFPEPLDADSNWEANTNNNSTVGSVDDTNDGFNFKDIPFSSVPWGSSPSHNAPNVEDYQDRMIDSNDRTSPKDGFFTNTIGHQFLNNSTSGSSSSGSSSSNGGGGTGSSIIGSFFQDGNFTSSLSSDPVQSYHLDFNLFSPNSTTSSMLNPYAASSNDTLAATNSSMSDAHSATGDIYTWSILLLAPLVVFGVAGNTLVILAISLEKRLQNVTNYFLLSLAVTDLLVSLIVKPISIINVFTGRWLFGLLVCDFFVTSDVLMCTSSIFHLCTISAERYIGIRYPLWTKNKSKRVVLLKIVLVWTLAFAVTSPITVLGVVKQENVLVEGVCVLNNKHFVIYGSIFAFYIPLTIMVLMYILTVRMLSKQAKLCNRRRGHDCEGEPMIRRSTSSKSRRGRPKYYGRNVTNSLRHQDLDDNLMSSGSFHPHYYELTTRSSTRAHYKTTRHSSLNRCGGSLRGDKSSGGGSSGVVGSGGNGGVILSSNSSPMGRRNNTLNVISTINNNKSNQGMLSAKNSKNGKNNSRRTRNGVLFDSVSGGVTRANVNDSRGNNNSSDYQYCNGHSSDLTINVTEDNNRQDTLSPSPTHDHKSLKDLVRKHHVALRAANILLMKKVDQEHGQMHLVPANATTTTGNTLLTQTPPSSTKASIRRDNSVKTEQKASKVLGVVFMIFVICWAPFFTVNILTVLCDSCEVGNTLVTAFVWLGYVSSTLNPIIYTIFNNIFRNTFIKLLCCRYRLLHRARRNSNMMRKENGIMSGSNCTSYSTASNIINANNSNINNNSNLSASNKASTSSVMDESNC